MKPVDASTFSELKERMDRVSAIEIEVATPEMEPCLREGSVVEVAPLPKKPRRFDIVVFWDGRSTLHFQYLWHVNTLGDWGGGSPFVTRTLIDDSSTSVGSMRLLGIVRGRRVPPRLRRRILLAALKRRLLG